MQEWFADEDYWLKLYPFIFSEERFDDAGQEVEGVLGLACPKGRDVLDLACGPGRHATAFAKRGFNVTGVDLSPFLLQNARELSAGEGVNVEWVQADMRVFVRHEAFDLAICLFTSLGYFADQQEDVLALSNVFQSLRTGASLVVELMGKECLASLYAPTGSQKLPDGRILVERRQVVDCWSRIRNEWIVIDEGAATTFEFEISIYSGQELKDRLLSIGFREVELFAGFDGSEYGSSARRLVAVARK